MSRKACVYTLRQDNRVYVGVSYVDTLPGRMAHHRNSGTNHKVSAMLENGRDYEVRVESRHRSWQLAHLAEKRLYRRLKATEGVDVLNRFEPGDEGAKLALERAGEPMRGRGWVRCCLCRQQQPRRMFQTDRNRHSKLASRCMDCMALFSSFRYRLKDFRPSVQYHSARGAIDAWVNGKYKGPHPLYVEVDDD